jgi:hypothetical protein
LQADFFVHSWQDQNKGEPGVDLQFLETTFYSPANYDALGNNVVPSGLQDYLRFQTDATAQYHLFAGLTAYGRLSWAYLVVNGTSGSTNGSSSQTGLQPGSGYGLTDQTVGLNYRLLQSRGKTQSVHSPPVFLDFQLQTDFPGYNNATVTANSSPFLGDGSIDMTAGLFTGVPLLLSHSEALNAKLGVAYTYRTLGFSAAIPWTAVFEYSPYDEGLTASLGAVGLTSLRTDTTASGSSRSSVGAGGSFFVGAINPSLISLRGSIGYRFEKDTELTLYGSQTLWGQEAPFGLTVALGFQTSLGPGKKLSPIAQSPHSYGHANQGFLNYSLDAKVLKTNDRMNLVKIDKGSQNGVEVGQFFDIFYVKKDGTIAEAIARGQVTSVKQEEAALEVIEYFKEVWIEEGFIAKRVIE